MSPTSPLLFYFNKMPRQGSIVLIQFLPVPVISAFFHFVYVLSEVGLSWEFHVCTPCSEPRGFDLCPSPQTDSAANLISQTIRQKITPAERCLVERR